MLNRVKFWHDERRNEDNVDHFSRGHQVVKNLTEPSEITLVHLVIYADYLRETDPKLNSRAVRALLSSTGRI